ncbi:hypothetical protein APY94_07795 [Thermococcus celericrescens]|uniref:Nucleotidyltransferase n=2 Tax=Thermococcus celericrescens TaxID=227598 RepID=A0A100XXD6_9EURY|nr:hypothetical protein APY94_07795 [Thermococcus celericrescens]
MPTIFEIIKSPKLSEKLEELIETVEDINDDYYPFEIREIHISGSVLRTSKARDVDITIHAFEVPEVKEEWEAFMKALRENKFNILNLVDSYREDIYPDRVNFEEFVYWHFEELTELGLEQFWVKNWLPLFRLGDFTEAAAPWDVRSSISTLIQREICKRIHCGNLELHVVYYAEGKWPEKEYFLKIPSIPIWDYNMGLLEISEDKLKEHFIKEFHRLIELSLKIIDGSIGVFAYRPAIYLMKEEGDNSFLTKIFREAVQREILILQKLVEKGRQLNLASLSIQELQDINTKLRNSQKHIEHLGIVWEATADVWDELIRTPMTYLPTLSKKHKVQTFEKLLLKMVSRRVISSYPRVIKSKDVKAIFEEVGLLKGEK